MVNPIPLLRGQYKHIVSGDGSVSPVLMSNTIARIEENGRVVENKSLSNTLRSIQYWICGHARASHVAHWKTAI